MRIGIIGTGFSGRAVARLAVQCGFDVMLSNSRDPRTIATTMIGYRVGTAEDAMAFGEIILLTVPFNGYRSLPPEPAAGKVLLDAVNYDPRRDGDVEALAQPMATSSTMITAHFATALVVKAFNAIVEKEIERDARPAGTPNRRALPIAGDSAHAKAVTTKVLDSLGFDSVDAGLLAEGWRFDRGQAAFGARLTLHALREALGLAGVTADGRAA